MFRWLGLLFLLVACISATAWMSMQSLPDWFQEEKTPEQTAIDRLKSEIEQTGALGFLSDKSKHILDGQIQLNELEFNALLLASLEADDEGRRLLSVSDAVRVFLRPDEVEFSIVVNLEKLEQQEPGSRNKVEKFDRLFPFLQDERVALTVYATPIVSNGMVGVKDDFHIKVGAIPISNGSLRQLKVPVERANSTWLKLKYLNVSSLALTDNGLSLGVRPALL